MASIKGYRLRITGARDALYLTQAQGQVVQAQMEAGARFIRLPGKTIKASAINVLEECEADESCFPAPPAVRLPGPSRDALFTRARVYVDGKETNRLPRALEREGVPYTIEQVEVLAVDHSKDANGKLVASYKYGNVLARGRVYYSGIYPVYEKL